MNFKTSIKVASLVSGVLLAQVADASHYRGGALVPSVNANGLVSFTSTSFWRRTTSTTLPQTFPVSGTTIEGTLTLNGSSVTEQSVVRTIDFTDSRYAKVTETYNVQLRSAGTANFVWDSCCHVSGISNSSGGAEALSSSITWDGKTSNTPIFFDFTSINPEVVRGQAYNDNLGALSGNGSALSYNNALTEGLNSQPAPSFSVDPNTGAITISAADTTAMTYDNTSNIGADYGFSGNINNADGSSVEFEWVFDAVDGGGSSNLAPVVNDMVLNVLQGDILVATVTGSDPDSDPLSWDLVSFLGSGDNGLFTFDDLTQGISWDTTGAGIGQYIALIRASDGSLTDTGAVTINVLSRNNVPEPSILALLGLGISGLAFTRRRRNKK